jgi:CubicO group peptidase (beta-lactamase class C family)
MNRLLPLLFLTVFSCFTATAQLKDTRLAGLDTLIARALKTFAAPGVAVAVVEKNKVIYAQGFGYRDYERKLPMTANTNLAIGSCTKAFTTALLGILEKEGKIDLNKPVNNYLPQLKFFNEYLTNHVTTIDMMSHRTGLPRHDFSWYGAAGVSRDSLLARIRYLEPSAELRERWQYNNFMYLAQGVLAEKLTGKSWEQNLRERILQPLGMSATNFTIDDLKKSAEPATGYLEKKDSIIKTDYKPLDAIGPAGSINSSVNDMAKWLITLINGGKYNGKEIVPASFLQTAASSQMAMGSFVDPKFPHVHGGNYGLGWFLSSYKGHYRVEHGGNIDGFSANVCFMPTDSIGVVVLTNQNGSMITSIVRNAVLDRMLKTDRTDWIARQKDNRDRARLAAGDKEKNDKEARIANTQPSHPLADYAGKYTHPGYGAMTITKNEQGLSAAFNGEVYTLKHYHYDVFNVYGDEAATDGETLKMKFNTNYKGEIESVSTPSLEPSVAALTFKKEISAIAVKQDDLKPFVGEYDLAGQTIKIYIKEEKLRAFIEGQPEYELVPVKPNEFALKGLDGYAARFNFNDKQQVTDILVMQPEGNFKAIRKEFMNKEPLKPVAVSKDKLEEYAGDYDLRGVTVKVSVKNNTLYVLVPGQPEYEQVATGADLFTFKAVAGFKLQFNRNSEGKISGLTFMQPNGNFEAKRK